MAKQFVSFNLSNIKAIEKRFDKKIVDVNNDLSKGLESTGFFMEAQVKQSIAGRQAEPKSVDTGSFLGGVFSVAKRLVVGIGNRVNHSTFLELGTSRLAPRAHYRNSFLRNKKKIIKFIVDILKK